MEPQHTETGKRLRFLVSISFLHCFFHLDRRLLWIACLCHFPSQSHYLVSLFAFFKNVGCHLSFPTCVCTSVGSFIARLDVSAIFYCAPSIYCCQCPSQLLLPGSNISSRIVYITHLPAKNRSSNWSWSCILRYMTVPPCIGVQAAEPSSINPQLQTSTIQ